jgi:hypothetical protein
MERMKLDTTSKSTFSERILNYLSLGTTLVNDSLLSLIQQGGARVAPQQSPILRTRVMISKCGQGGRFLDENHYCLGLQGGWFFN